MKRKKKTGRCIDGISPIEKKRIMSEALLKEEEINWAYEFF
jgi:hypothetical protein